MPGPDGQEGVATRPAAGAARALVVLAACALTLLLVGHRSANPWLLDRWSLPVAVAALAGYGGLALLHALLGRHRRRLLFSLLASGLGLGAIAAAVELGGRVYMDRQPAFDTLFLEPDPVLGWRGVPEVAMPWAGHDRYAREFSTMVRRNSRGFHDREHPLARPAEVTRVAVLGDSLVEAIQVPREETAVALLERLLGPGWEALSFGVSNYGVGQFLLTWEEHARDFEPRVVFVLLASFHLSRTVEPEVVGGALTGRPQGLALRPMFHLDGERLLREGPRDHERAREMQRALIDGLLAGAHHRRRDPGSFLGPQLATWTDYYGLLRLQRQLTAASPEPRFEVAPEVMRLNLALLTELGEQVEASGARLVLVDASRVLSPGPHAVPRELSRLARERDYGFIDFSARMTAAEGAGVTVQFPRDRHFTAAGNRLFADAMAAWLRDDQAR